MNDRVIVRRL